MISLLHTPWANPSNDDQRVHAILHAVKAAGKLAAILELEGHNRIEKGLEFGDQWKYAADLVIAAIRLSELCGFDLEVAVYTRQKGKNHAG